MSGSEPWVSGVMMGIWKSLFVGVDLVLRPESQVRIGQ